MRWSFAKDAEVTMFPMTSAAQAAMKRGGYEMESDPQLAAVVQALDDDEFIRAVKEFRIATGVGLRTAKEAVETIVKERST